MLSMKLELLTNATVVYDAIGLYQESKSKIGIQEEENERQQELLTNIVLWVKIKISS